MVVIEDGLLPEDGAHVPELAVHDVHPTLHAESEHSFMDMSCADASPAPRDKRVAARYVAMAGAKRGDILLMRAARSVTCG